MSDDERTAFSDRGQRAFGGIAAGYPPHAAGYTPTAAAYPPRVAFGYPQRSFYRGLPITPQPLFGGFPVQLQPRYYGNSYLPVRGMVIVDGRPLTAPHLPCCGLGVGWFLFIIGFLLPAIPWYIAALILIFSRVHPREKQGYLACAIAAVLATFAIILCLSRLR
ncbi:uncharacterized protein LOC127248012 [Andrographis paniculata]|uniref:uncharacterized protein LOC127248012 n=1 Tax=Andrographis paniculata TaxID=175694 RepID=UPI0021E8872F|nr:uncharacterized protein LOC127248012 [Andrographis paniculata]